MVNKKGLLLVIFTVLVVFALSGSVWAGNRAVRSLDAVDAFSSRISRGQKLFSLGSPGGGNSNSSNDFTPLFESSSPGSSGSAGTSTSNGNGNNSSIPANLNIYLNLIGVSIDGQNILQGNNLDSTQIALLAQNANADLLALNIATIIQNNIQIGLNFNVSPIVNVVVSNGVDVPVNVNVESPDVNVGPINIQVGGV
jgi:hypothetical protein